MAQWHTYVGAARRSDRGTFPPATILSKSCNEPYIQHSTVAFVRAGSFRIMDTIIVFKITCNRSAYDLLVIIIILQANPKKPRSRECHYHRSFFFLPTGVKRVYNYETLIPSSITICRKTIQSYGEKIPLVDYEN